MGQSLPRFETRYARFETTLYHDQSSPEEHQFLTSEASSLYFLTPKIGNWYSGSRGISSQRGTHHRCQGMMKAKQLQPACKTVHKTERENMVVTLKASPSAADEMSITLHRICRIRSTGLPRSQWINTTASMFGLQHD
jgi:hypothetical protein